MTIELLILIIVYFSFLNLRGRLLHLLQIALSSDIVSLQYYNYCTISILKCNNRLYYLQGFALLSITFNFSTFQLFNCPSVWHATRYAIDTVN